MISKIRAALAASCLLAAPALAQDISSEPLRPLDPLDAGALSRDAGALPETLWAGSTAASAKAALNAVPAGIVSPTVNDLLRRTLASGGEPPEGGVGDSDLAAARLLTLWRAGFVSEVSAIAARTPNLETAPLLSRVKAEADLALGEIDDACEAENRLEEGRNDLFWLQLRAICQARAGSPAASLSIDLARNAGADEDFEIALTLAEGVSIETVRPLDALVLGTALNSDTTMEISLADTPPRFIAALAAGKGPPSVKPALAYEAAKAGWISPAALAEVFSTITPDAETGLANPADPLSAALAAEGLARRALMYRAARTGPVEDRIEAIETLLTEARAADERLLAARLTTPLIEALPPRLGDRVLFAEAAAIAGRPGLAQRLLTQATTPPPPAPMPETGRETGPAQLTAPRPAFTPPSPQTLARVEALMDVYPETRRELSVERWSDRIGPQGAAAMLALNGRPMSADMRARALSRGDGAAPALGVLHAAAESEAQAETALLAVTVLGPELRNEDPASLHGAIRALRAAGLEGPARAIAIELFLIGSE